MGNGPTEHDALRSAALAGEAIGSVDLTPDPALDGTTEGAAATSAVAHVAIRSRTFTMNRDVIAGMFG